MSDAVRAAEKELFLARAEELRAQNRLLTAHSNLKYQRHLALGGKRNEPFEKLMEGA